MKLIFGMVRPKPLRGFPAGRVRLRLRCDAWASAAVVTRDGIRRFYLEDTGRYWRPGLEIGRNEWQKA
jgi:hypothetical protein